MEKENAVLPQIVDSVLGAVPVVGGGLQNAYDAWRQKNINMAREVLLTHVRQGDVDKLHEDQFFSMLARFSRSVQEGLARSNLVLLARLITGIGRADQDSGKAETFNRYASMLENLTWAEIVFLSQCIQENKVVPGPAEIKQILHQKGFFVQSFDTTVSGNKRTDVSSTGINLGDAYRYADLGQVVRNPYDSVNLHTIWGGLDIQEPTEVQKNTPYKVNIDIKYEFSSRFDAFLQKYGNLWEDISKESTDGGADDQ